METCEDCGFVWESVARDAVGGRVFDAAEAIAETLLSESVLAEVRPSAERWSAVEYGAHVRDVMLMMRDRIVVGLVEDLPEFKPMYRDERIRLGLYRDESAESLAADLPAAATMFAGLFDSIDDDSLIREVHYGFPAPAVRSLLWLGQQVVHEVEHHRGDVEENIRLLSAGR